MWLICSDDIRRHTDFTTASFYAAAVRDAYMQLPAEGHVEGEHRIQNTLRSTDLAVEELRNCEGIRFRPENRGSLRVLNRTGHRKAWSIEYESGHRHRPPHR